VPGRPPSITPPPSTNGCGSTGPGRAADNSVSSSSVTTDHDSANLGGHHHYLSSAERANDALLITEVKSALSDDGVAHDVAIVVDCDHS
jgi:hypothetical protein